jgi:hypothetical protein
VSDPVDRTEILGAWVHAHEEDTATEMVLVPASRDLPPSRGRLRIDLRDDGTLIQGSPGPDDRPTEAAGSWELSADGVLGLRPVDGPGWEAKVVSAAPERLVLEPRDRVP